MAWHALTAVGAGTALFFAQLFVMHSLITSLLFMYLQGGGQAAQQV
jgi:hypothetical protein